MIIKKAKILAVDNHAIVLNGIKYTLEDILIDYRSASNHKEAIDVLTEYKPDLIIVDYTFPDESGDIMVREIKHHYPHIKVLAYAFDCDEEIVMKMLLAGVSGYILKRSNAEEFKNAVLSILNGKEFFCQEARNHIFNRLSFLDDNIKIKVGEFEFSKREIEIIRMICKEKTSKEISQSIYLSERTIEIYRHNIARKIGAKSSVGVIKFAIKNGILKAYDL